ncbi:Vps62-related protein [Pseudomonas sp. ADAK13]|uniref:Vps62-related protein n=1 Tax=Pseudomonas sp. ADAK13 TaxID=2730847 RepID=UPI00146313A3|nr:Vps62-related protein [Pseudomonas sp. ADAK13]QJI34514.1 Vps62-related protein [Pseudomonas sp. ADAK13]
MQPIRFKDLLINFTTEFDLLWSAKDSGADNAATFWRPNTTADSLNSFSSLGDVVASDYRTINNRKFVAVVSEADPVNGTALRAPVGFNLIWKNSGKKTRSEFSVWKPVPPEGYVAMGMACCIGYDKPTLNAVRCVRADLAVDAYIGNAIWNDKGSGARMDFSAWDVHTPDVEPEAAYIATGTFYGTGGWTRPSFGARPYALRMELACQESTLPAPPAPFASVETEPSPTVCELPWFAVKDSNLTPFEQLHHSPRYRLERTDRYLSVGLGQNTTPQGKTFNWTAHKGEAGDNSIDFTAVTGIQLAYEWSSTARPVMFSAHLSNSFTHTTQSAKGWGTSTPLEVAAYVPANQTIAAYVIRSEYKLYRQDGSQLAATVSYTNGDTVYFSESSASIPEGNEQAPVLALPVEPVPALPSVEPALEITPHDVIDNALVP